MLKLLQCKQRYFYLCCNSIKYPTKEHKILSAFFCRIYRKTYPSASTWIFATWQLMQKHDYHHRSQVKRNCDNFHLHQCQNEKMYCCIVSYLSWFHFLEQTSKCLSQVNNLVYSTSQMLSLLLLHNILYCVVVLHFAVHAHFIKTTFSAS